MPQARGRKGQLLLDYESVFGSDPGSPNGILMPFISCGVRAAQNLIEDNTIRNSRNPSIPFRGNIDVSGSIVVPVEKIGIGYWLRAMFGAPQTSGTGPYTHVFKPGDTQPSLVLERGFTDIGQYFKYNGCKVSRASIDFGGDAAVQMSLDIMGAKETLGAASYDATPTAIVQENYHMFQLAIEECGAAIAIVVSGNLQIDFGLDGEQYAIGGGGVRADIPEGLVQVTGNVRAFFQDAVLLNKAINGTESSLKLTWTSGAHSLELLVPELMYERSSPGIDGPRGVLVELPFRGYAQDAAAGTVIQATLVNTQATYA